MDMQRRQFNRATGLAGVLGLMVGAGLLSARDAAAQQAAWNKAAFEAKSVADTVKALGAASTTPSGDITITAPDIAENGAVVPVTVTSRIPNTQRIYVLVEKNPNALAAGFTLPEGTDSSVATRIKLAQTSDVHAVVKAGDQFFVATKEIKVTLGGCGG
jgi:sulfur-oxidizing protein SoxY